MRQEPLGNIVDQQEYRRVNNPNPLSVPHCGKVEAKIGKDSDVHRPDPSGQPEPLPSFQVHQQQRQLKHLKIPVKQLMGQQHLTLFRYHHADHNLRHQNQNPQQQEPQESSVLFRIGLSVGNRQHHRQYPPVKAKRHQIENNAAQYSGNRAPVYGKQPRKLGAVMIGARNPSVDPQDSAFSNGVKNRPDAGKQGQLLPYRNAALAAGLPDHACAIQQRQEQEHGLRKIAHSGKRRNQCHVSGNPQDAPFLYLSVHEISRPEEYGIHQNLLHAICRIRHRRQEKRQRGHDPYRFPIPAPRPQHPLCQQIDRKDRGQHDHRPYHAEKEHDVLRPGKIICQRQQHGIQDTGIIQEGPPLGEMSLVME